ncbi:MAG: F0F1 ATP synthase subunit B [Butyricicoccaceae bacterium]
MDTLSIFNINVYEIITQIINLLLMCLLLSKFLLKPVTKMLEARQNDVDANYADSETAKAEAETLRDDYAKRIAEAKNEAAQITKAAADKANAQGAQIIAEAQQQAAHLKQKAEQQIEMERKKAVNELKNEISGIAIDIAEKVVEREINAKDHEALIQQFIEGVGEAS